MTRHRIPRVRSACFAVVMAPVGLCYPPSTLAVGAIKLWTFQGSPNDGSDPLVSPIVDKTDDLYGTTNAGGAYGFGTVYELKPPAVGQNQWTENILWSFGNGTDGSGPSGLIADGHGNLFGTTGGGGVHGDGTVYELTPPAAGQTAWTETVLWSFGGFTGDAKFPSGVVADASGNLYGTASGGGRVPVRHPL